MSSLVLSSPVRSGPALSIPVLYVKVVYYLLNLALSNRRTVLRHYRHCGEVRPGLQRGQASLRRCLFGERERTNERMGRYGSGPEPCKQAHMFAML